MRTMTVEKLLKGMPILQSQIDALLDFEVSHSQISISIISLSPLYILSLCLYVCRCSPRI